MQLVDTFDISRIENDLLSHRNTLIQATSTLFNVVLIGLTILCFGYFLYVQHQTVAAEEVAEKHIKFEPIPWLSATRNVRMEEYGRQLKPFEIENGYGVPGHTPGESIPVVYRDHPTGLTE
jgi:hypothetical protein